VIDGAQEYLVNKHIFNLPDDVDDIGGSDDISSQASEDSSNQLQLHFHDLVVRPQSTPGESGSFPDKADSDRSYGETDERKLPDPELSRPLLRADQPL
jgi:hypothetical protein